MLDSRRLVLLCLLALGLAATAYSDEEMSAERRLEERAKKLKEVSSELVCQCSCNMILSECSHQGCPFALPEREKILARIDAGDSKDTIIRDYVAQFGRSVLSAPPTSGGWIHCLAWAAPYGALALGALLVSWLVRTFTRRQRTGGAASAGTDDAFRRAVERDLGPGPDPGSAP